MLVFERIAALGEKGENLLKEKKVSKEVERFLFIFYNKFLLLSIGSWKTWLANCKVIIENSKSNEMYN